MRKMDRNECRHKRKHRLYRGTMPKNVWLKWSY